MTAFEQAVTELEIYGFTLIPNVLNSNQVDLLKTKLISKIFIGFNFNCF